VHSGPTGKTNLHAGRESRERLGHLVLNALSECE
jgi:hypothetical protein